MPLPVSYSPARLAEFMITELGEVGTALSWNSGSPQVLEAVTDVTLLLGVEELEIATNVQAVRSTARVVAWRAAGKAVAAQYTFSEENGVKYDRSDLQKLVLASLAIAESEAVSDETAPQVKVGTMRYFDPYAPAAQRSDVF